MSKVLVTGGGGFIGSHIVDHFIDAGHDVVVVDDLCTGSRDNVNAAARFIEMDVTREELGEVFAQEKPDVVNHLAAQINVTLSLKKPVFDAHSNVVGTVNVLQQCVEHDVKKFIFASTAGAIYGNTDDLPVPEDFPPRPQSHYGTSKLAAEHYIRLYGDIYQLPYTILRYSNVYGPRQDPHGEAGVCAILILAMLEGKTPTLYGHGKPLRDYVYVGDIARASLLAMSSAEGATVNLGTGKGTSVREVFDGIKELLQFEGEPILKPLRPGEVFNIYASCGRAESLLGWTPEVNLREGLERTVEMFKSKRHG